MITQIKELKKVGIFKNHIAPTSLPEYKKYNLIYGWNGSGKSTLSRIFSCIGQHPLTDHFPDSKAKITLSDGTELNETNIHQSDLNIKVFNQAFIDKNIDWKGKLNSILYVSEEKIEKKTELDETKKKYKEKKSKYDEISVKLDQKKDEKEKFLKSSAKSIKTIFQAIETTDQRFLSYNKAHIEKLIDSEYEVLSSKEVFLDKEEFNKIKNAIKPQQKSEIQTLNVEVNTQVYLVAEASIKKIIEASVVSKAIDRLLEFPKLNEWVSHGLELHNTLDSQTCEYCGSTISDERIQQLEEHFNKDYERLIARIHKATGWIDSQQLPVTSLPSSDEFYEEFLASYNEKHDKLIEYYSKYKKVLEQWKSILTEKLQNPFRKIEEAVSSIEDLLSNIVNTINEINKIIEAHNLKTQNFEKHLSGNKKRLERHLVAEQMKTFDFSKFKADSDSLSKDFGDVGQKLTELKTKESTLEKELLNEAIAVEEFNENIHKFLGRNDLSLYFDTKHKGYKIIRGSNTEMAQHLSEGEKTAIAFIYFITTLKEKGNKLDESILWIDDPISSFDTNHLFNAFVFLVKKCHSCKQLFITTHNFWFFKLVRDWMTKDGRRRESSFYVIDSFFIDSNRISTITEANKSIVDFHSEYHFLFSQIVRHYDKPVIDFETSYMLANAGRRVLESILTFKYPKTKDLRALINKTSFDTDKKERIYWFVQKFSHSDRIETHESIPDNLFSEGHNVIRDIVDLIKEIEPEHYQELVEIGN